MQNPKISEDEKIFSALAYIFPFQFFIYFLSKPAGLYTPFFKKHFKNSCFLYFIIFLMGFIAFLFKRVNFPESLQIFRSILLVIMFSVSVLILLYMFIKAYKIFDDNN